MPSSEDGKRPAYHIESDALYQKVYGTKTHLRLRIANICIFNICTSSLVTIDDSRRALQWGRASPPSLHTAFNALCVHWILILSISFSGWRGCSTMAAVRLENTATSSSLISQMRLAA